MTEQGNRMNPTLMTIPLCARFSAEDKVGGVCFSTPQGELSFLLNIPFFSVVRREKFYPPTQKATVFETVDECQEGTLRSSYERSGVCFGGFRPTKHVEELRASARGGSTLSSSLQKLPLFRKIGMA